MKIILRKIKRFFKRFKIIDTEKYFTINKNSEYFILSEKESVKYKKYKKDFDNVSLILKNNTGIGLNVYVDVNGKMIDITDYSCW